MPENTTEQAAPLPVWRRAPGTGRSIPEDERPLQCGGPAFGVQDAFSEMRDRKWAEANGLPFPLQTEDPSAATPDPAEKATDGDENQAAERLPNDRYAVKLLRQDDSVWSGSGPGDTGMLG